VKHVPSAFILVRRIVALHEWLLALVLALLSSVCVAQVLPVTLAASTAAGGDSALHRDVQATATDLSSAANLVSQLKAVEAGQDNNGNATARLVELLKSGIAAAQRTRTLRADIDRLRAQMTAAPARRDELRSALVLPLETNPPRNLADGLEPKELESELRVADAAASDARQELQALTEGLVQQRLRPAQIRQSTLQAKKVLAEIAAALQAPAIEGESAREAEIRLAVLGARQRMRNVEVAYLKEQLLAHDQLLALLGAEQEFAQRALAVADARLSGWRQRVQVQRARAAAATKRAAKETQESLATMPNNVRAIADRSSWLAKTLTEVTAKEAETTQRLTRAEARLQELDDDLTSIQQRVAIAGLNETIALVLRKQQVNLPTLGQYRARAALLREQTSWASGLQIDAERARSQLVNINAVTSEVLRNAEPALAPVAVAYLRPQVDDLHRQIKSSADSLHQATSRYIKQLGRLDNAQRQLVSRAVSFQRLIREHLLWVRSTSVLSPAVVPEVVSAAAWLMDLRAWLDVVARLALDLVSDWLRWLGGVGLLLLLICLRPWLTKVVERESEQTLKVRTDRIGRTLKSLAAIVAVAATFPLAIFAAGWKLQALSLSGDFSFAIGAGLRELATISFGFNFLMHLLRDGSIGDLQFKWPQAARHSLRRHLRWLAPSVWLLGFVIWVSEAQDNETIQTSLGRIAFIVAMIALAVFLWRVLRPHGALFIALRSRGSASLLVQLQYVWVTLGVGAPVSLAVLSTIGYHYSALQLQERLQATAWLIVLLAVVGETLMRALVVARRRMAFQIAVEERLAERRARQSLREETDVRDEETAEFAEPEVSVDDLQAQAGSLLRTTIGVVAILGMWATWADVLPALNLLNDVVLWHVTEVRDGVEALVKISAVDLAVSMLVAALAYVSAKNLPGALELLLLNNTSLDAGAKYAFTTLLRYVIVGTGITVLCSLLGMEWSKLQWLVAALSVGLGFGLQEIVANFVSGLILLFERPIRIGDVVTVNESTGTVARIQIRATTLIDFDRKELIMPNKVFITGEVLNWTLSDQTNRVLINVGVAYGSDTQRAMQLMVAVANNCETIVSDPAPIATFEGFGDNTLNLVLRCYMPSLERRLQTLTELHSGINEAFTQEGISIAFPQRDVHLNTTTPLSIRMLPTTPK
jgi:potassium-dependent mechanosensitive channel